MGDVIVIAILSAIVGLVVRSMWRNHKEGKTSCGCAGNCSNCAAQCYNKRTE